MKLASVAALLLALSGMLPRSAAALPTEAYARPPQAQVVALSPSGQWFAAIVNREADSVVVVRPVDGSAPPRALVTSDNRESTLAWVHWASEQRLVISLRFPSTRWGADSVETRLIAIDRDGSDRRGLVDPIGPTSSVTGQVQDVVVDWLPQDGHHILVQRQVDLRDIWPGVFRLDIDSGRSELVQGRRAFVRRWLTDGAHRVRVGLRQEGTQVEVLLCDADGGHWRSAWSYELFSPQAVEPLGFGADPDRLYVRADHEGRAAVFEVDLRDPALPRRLLLAAPEGDVEGRLVVDPATGKALGLNAAPAGRAAEGYWDDAGKALARSIDEALPDRYNRLLQFSADGRHYLLHSSGNGSPGQFFLGDRTQGKLEALARQYPALPAQGLARKSRHTIVARDGLKLPLLLTLPAGVNPAASPLPVVVLPHGGPISEDTLDFDPLPAFLADRGYAVLQVNFRGSGGQGWEHRNAGLQRWGLEMQDDISDAVQWLLQRGTADPARVCIVGGSFGGYAALMGGATTPQLYRCIVSVAGVTDLVDMATRSAGYVNGSDVFGRMVGAAWGDRARLQETSPVNLAVRFRAPVLLVQGTLDRSVPASQATAMAEALKAAGKDYRLVMLEGGDHNLSHAPHRLQFYRELEAFLAQQLQPAPRPGEPANRP